jgi:hypothetical protein
LEEGEEERKRQGTEEKVTSIHEEIRRRGAKHTSSTTH